MAKFKALISSPNKTKPGLFFDSSKYKVIVQSIESFADDPEDNDYDPETELMDVDEVEDESDNDDENETHFNVKTFEEVLRSAKGTKTNHLMAAIEEFVEKEKTSFLKVLCFLGQRKFYKMKGKRKLATLFKNIAEKEEKFLEPNELTINEAVAAKQTLNLSYRGYDNMKKIFKGKVIMPTPKKVSAAENALTPKATPYLDGVKYDLKECLSRTIERTFGVLQLEVSFSKAKVSYVISTRESKIPIFFPILVFGTEILIPVFSIHEKMSNFPSK